MIDFQSYAKGGDPMLHTIEASRQHLDLSEQCSMPCPLHVTGKADEI